MSVLSQSGHIALSARKSIVVMGRKSSRVDLNLASGQCITVA